MSEHSVVPIGPLEARILNVLWDREARTYGSTSTVRDVYETLLCERRISYTTVMTIFTNLTRKGLLTCDSSDKAYTYLTTRSREDVGREALGAVFEQLLGGRIGIMDRFIGAQLAEEQ